MLCMCVCPLSRLSLLAYPPDVSRTLLQHVAVSQLLLVLILKVPHVTLLHIWSSSLIGSFVQMQPVASSKYAQVLDDYSTDALVQNPPTGTIMNEELFILLQSLVVSTGLAC